MPNQSGINTRDLAMRGTLGQQRILAVDDEPSILRLLQEKLERGGFEVWVADSGETALALIERQGLPHLAIVDLQMPGISGFEFCHNVQQFSDLPIIILTANDQEETVIRGLEQFAEDYIIKPFSPRELVARVRRVLRRIGDFAYTLEATTQIDKRLAVNFAHQCAQVAGSEISLTPTETKILYILIRNAGRAVTNDFLLRRLWPDEDVFEDTLRVHIHRLRQKIEVQPNAPHYIITERGVGYIFPKQ